ncbi:MAG: hypothetical protein OXC93_12835, partial [Rhodospirillaceae bacterium]|nr:hypothetical protein [Rhodospirillaceae bacterium]
RRPGPAHPALGRDRRGDQRPRRVRQIVLPIVVRPARLRPGGRAPGHATLLRRWSNARQGTTARGHTRLQEQILTE